MNEKNNPLEETTLSTKPIYQGRVISLQLDEVRLPNGQPAIREVVKHPGAVAVLALLDDKMLVVEQYRKPLERTLMEIPAGKLEPGEDILEAAKRELEEETGYTCGSIRKISSFATAPGFCDEMMHLYVAEQLEPGQINPDEDEFIVCTAITLEEAWAYVREQRIHDAKTLAAIYAWQTYKLTGTFLP